MKRRSFPHVVWLFALFFLSFDPIFGGSSVSAVLPEVKITANPWKTSEPCPVCRVAPAVVHLETTGPTNKSITVFLEVDGTAVPGADYGVLPRQIEIPAGTNRVEIMIAAVDDPLKEGPEVVRVTLVEPLTDAVPQYMIDAGARQVLVVIFDTEEGAPEASLDIIAPKEGDHLAPGLVEVSAIGVYSQGELYLPVEFYSGKTLIGRSAGSPFARPPIPGWPSVHTIQWTNPPPGSHSLWARTELTASLSITSSPVNITVAFSNQVSIKATRPIAEESSFPLRRLPLRGEFTISREGSTNTSQNVFVHYAGSAVPGEDFPRQPFLVTIPAGAVSTSIEIVPNPDSILEGIETVVATISNCPPETDPPLGIPCYAFPIDPAQESATVFIREDGITRESVAITKPKEGDPFRIGATIPIEAVAIDLEAYLSRVEFWDGEKLLGVSDILFVRAPDPGTPIHHSFEWREASPGAHELTARARRSDGTELKSPPVHVTVGPAASQPPQISITGPKDGAIFPATTPIQISATGTDPDGYIPRAEFFADGRKLGEQNIEFIRRPDPGQKQTFEFTWQSPLPGSHDLTVQATDDAGAVTMSSSVNIQITPQDALPIVTVTPRDALAVESWMNAANPVLNTASFEIRRLGPTNAPLTVYYAMSGSASNKVDYESLSGQVVIPAGRRTIPVIVRPLPDNLPEPVETVILVLEDSRAFIPEYRAGFPRRSVALISDPGLPRPGNGAERLADGSVNVTFAPEAGLSFRLEMSNDLKTWQTVCEALAGDGTVNYVDDEAQNAGHRFYRLIPSSLPPPDE